MIFFPYHMGPPQVSFFAYYKGPPQISFFAHYMGAPLRSVSLLTKWGPSVQILRLIFSIFKKMYALSYPWGAPIFLNFQGGASAPSCPAPAGAHGCDILKL